MKKLAYTILTVGEAIEATGSVADLLREIPYFLTYGIPNQRVINSVLRKGIIDSGMSGGVEWEPFEIDEREFSEVVSSLSDSGSEILSLPQWVATEDDLLVWIYEKEHGVPAKEHKQLQDACRNTEFEISRVEDQGEDELVESLHLRYIDESNALVEFIDKHMKR
ncbi:MAG: hypothetical protein JAZ17_13730 [Candidatus Thiodiazotropha endolucinida]|nr:hypothetical protein [Candidatus Thiodiazotropha taylori]MCG8094658.1 hypothetical protein [Candidatus Thiodiazotropha endolucinida]MCW4342749.1 hypothetical protein [Candidatus Thiodiazotropha endolucinida]